MATRQREIFDAWNGFHIDLLPSSFEFINLRLMWAIGFFHAIQQIKRFLFFATAMQGFCFEQDQAFLLKFMEFLSVRHWDP